MDYENQHRGNGKAWLGVEAMTGGYIQLGARDGDGDHTVVDLTYEEAIELADKLRLAAELVGKPPATVAELYELFNKPEGDPDAAA